MRIDLYMVFCCVSCLGFTLFGQNSKGYPLKTKKIVINQCATEIDSYTLMHHSVLLLHDQDTLTNFTIQNHTLYLPKDLCDQLLGDTITIRYRTFGFDFEKTYYTIDSSLLSFKEKPFITGYEYRPSGNKNSLVDAKGLDYRGSFSRGFSVGNSQSLVPNSNFDMQLNGDLGNGLKVVAAISDENLPIQAQGNTQQLQEFDKVFIQVSKGKTSVTAGDYELRKPNSYFMNYFKKLKGVSLATTVPLKNGNEIYSKGSFAISRGKFARQTLPTKEGNQGPYRLQGNNGERFIIVLAGTEKVYFNGNLLTRGFDYDYVIDYNRADITFSPRRIVARDSRVIIEFEYTDISYLRSLYATQTEFKSEKWNINLNFYSEQDSKNTTGDLQLDSTDIGILQNSGDDLSRTVRQSIRMVTEEEKKETNRILYFGKSDPIDPSNIILAFTENLDSASYTAVFSEVGQGKGDYIIDNTKNKNGRIYLYVGKGQGTYLPVIQLIPPEQKQLITLNGTYRFNKDIKVFSEVAMSNYDINRRSAIGNDDNIGIASNVALSYTTQLDSNRWEIGSNVKHEFVQRHFKALNPYRSPEFVRDWNITQLSGIADENLLLTNLNINGKNGFGASYSFNRFEKGSLYVGNKHEGDVHFENKRWNLKAFANILTSASPALDQSSRFVRPNVTIQYKIGKSHKWATGFVLDAENNQLRSISKDTLSKASYAFQNLKWFVTNDFADDAAVRISYSIRDDYFSKSNQLTKASIAKEVEIAGKWIASSQSDLQWSIIGRQLDIQEQDLLPNDKSKKTILGRIDYTFSLLNQGVRSITSYNTNSGQEPKIEYVFQKVDAGQGEYYYIGDTLNPNLSVIQDFRYDPTNPLSRYIRLALTNNEFVRTNNNEINQTLHIEPSKFKKPKEGVKFSKSYLFLSKFSTISNIRVTKKQMENAAASLFSYLDFGVHDTSLVAYNALYANTLFFNRGNVAYDIQLGVRNNQNRTVQISGKEDRGLDDVFFRSRTNIFGNIDVFFILERSLKTYVSEAFPTRNLDILIQRIKPEISIRPTSNTRVLMKYAYQDKRQRILTKDVAYINDVTSEFTIRKANQYSIDFSLSLVKIKFSGISNSPLEYDMLDGLKNGQNFLWNSIFTKRIAKNIDLTFNYEGRKTGISKPIHIGRVQVKATF